MADMIKCKSLYHPPAPEDGERIYVDRLWPEGISTRSAAVTRWAQEAAPSYELWRYQFSPAQWADYRRLYWQELSQKSLHPLLRELKKKSEDHTITLLYGTKDESHNNAVALKEYLENLDNRDGKE